MLPRKLQKYRNVWLTAAWAADRIPWFPFSYTSHDSVSIWIIIRPFIVQYEEQATFKNTYIFIVNYYIVFIRCINIYIYICFYRIKTSQITFSISICVSSDCVKIELIVCKICDGNHNESSSGSKFDWNRSSLRIF